MAVGGEGCQGDKDDKFLTDTLASHLSPLSITRVFLSKDFLSSLCVTVREIDI